MRLFRGAIVVSATLAATAGLSRSVAGQILDNQTLAGTTVFPAGSTVTVINDLTLDQAQVDVYSHFHFEGINTLGGTELLAPMHLDQGSSYSTTRWTSLRSPRSSGRAVG